MDAVEVRIWGSLVGGLGRDPQSGEYVFEYAPRWMAKGIELAPFKMPVVHDRLRRQWRYPNEGEGLRGLPGLLADALPDAFGNSLINAYMASKKIRPEDVSMIDRLAYMAKRGMGALEFRPPLGYRKDSAEPLEMSELVDEARRAAAGNIGDSSEAADGLQRIIQVGTSAGGARPKAVIAWNPVSGEIRSGQFDVPAGFEHWLLKFDGVGEANADLGTPKGYGRIEYAYYLMAQDAGIDMTECRLLEEADRAHFMTKRFDRTGNVKHHIQSLCALQHLDYKQPRAHSYEQFFLTISGLGLPEAARIQAFRRMAFNQMAANHDDHTKNFAFLMKQGGAWELAPAFDVTYAYRSDSKWVSAHQLSVNGKNSGVSRDDMMTIADQYRIPGAKGLLDSVAKAVRGWRGFAAAARIPEADVERIMKSFAIV